MERIDPHAELERAAFVAEHFMFVNVTDGLVDVAEDGQTSIGVVGEQMPLDGLAAIRVGLEG